MRKLFLLATPVLIGVRLTAHPPDIRILLAGRQPGNSLFGAVTDAADGRPLAGVSVFLNNTSRGTVTRTDGTFRLPMPKGIYELVVSAIGYKTRVMDIDGNRLPDSLKIQLHQMATELAAVTVEPYEVHGWSKWGKFFWNNFIGTGENAASCSIKNKDVLRFHFYKRSNRLSVTAVEPLIIENKALGYMLEYRLEEFVSDLNTHVVTWSGYPFFQEMTTKKDDQRRAWAFHRQQAYKGSMMHFMRSLYAGHSIAEGFIAEEQVVMPNYERRRIREIYHPDFQGPGTFPMDTLYHFWEVLKEPDPITRNVLVPPDSLITVDSDDNRRLYFDRPLTVIYGANDRSQNFYQSGVQLMSSTPITVEENGNYYPPREILTTGHWAQSEKISNLLPLDYGY